jgi:hypothetical protein
VSLNNQLPTFPKLVIHSSSGSEERQIGPEGKRTNEIPQWSTFLLEKLAVSQLVKKLHALCGNRKFVTTNIDNQLDATIMVY